MTTKTLTPALLAKRRKEAEEYIATIPDKLQQWKAIDDSFQYDLEQENLAAEFDEKLQRCNELGFDDLSGQIQDAINTVIGEPTNLSDKKQPMNNDDFLPDNYSVPSSNSQYMRFQDGENRFRILSKPIIGWEDWDDSGHPTRFRMNAKPTSSASTKKDAKIKHFWAMTVWNVNEKKLQILEITQVSVQNMIKAFSQDPDWGNPREYDIVVSRSGQSLDTEYQVMAKPKSPIPVDALEALESTPINLESLFDNKDPFAQ